MTHVDVVSHEFRIRQDILLNRVGLSKEALLTELRPWFDVCILDQHYRKSFSRSWNVRETGERMTDSRKQGRGTSVKLFKRAKEIVTNGAGLRVYLTADTFHARVPE